MSYTDFIQHSTGATLYAKGAPLDATWANNVVALSENGATGSYSSALFVDGTTYIVYVQAGGSPASSDSKSGAVVYPPVTGGTATAANQTTIIASLAAAASVISPVVDSSTIQIISPDHYDGTAGTLLTWTVAKDYTTATSVKLVIYDKDTPATVLKTATAVVASSTSITVDLDVDFGSSLTFAGCPLTAHCGFALVADWSGEAETIARGDCYVYDRGIPA